MIPTLALAALLSAPPDTSAIDWRQLARDLPAALDRAEMREDSALGVERYRERMREIINETEVGR
jgi:hypothetical protein